MDTYLPHVGFVQFPRTPADLGSAVCPACFSPRKAGVCSACGLALDHPVIAELDAASADAAASLDRRLELIGRIRYETAQAAMPVPVVAAAAVVSTPSPVVSVASSARPFPSPADSAPDAAPRRHLGVQVILLLVGVSLLSVGAIFFLVYAFITFGLVWRSVIIGAVTVAAFVGASLLRRRRLSVAAEAIAALAVVFVYLDAFAIRANDLLGAGGSDALVYWGIALLVSAGGFVLWHHRSGLRLPSIVAFLTFGPGLALLAGGVSGPWDDDVRAVIAFAALGASGLIHPLARARRVERTIAVIFSIVGLLLAGLLALAVDPINDWAPLPWLLIVAIVAGAQIALGSRAPRVALLLIAGIGAVAAASAATVIALRIADDAITAFAPAVVATAVALVFEVLAHHAPAGHLRSAGRVAAWTAAVWAGITLLIPLGQAANHALTIAAAGVDRWSIPGGTTLVATPALPAAILALLIVTVITGAAWAATGTAPARRVPLLAASIVVAVLAVPLLGVQFGVVLGWLVLAVAGCAALIMMRSRGVGHGIRATVAVGALTAAALAYSISWASIDTWWFASVAIVGMLVAARLATALAPVRAALLAVAVMLAFVAVGSEGWHTNERFAGGAGAPVDALHFVVALAVVLLVVAPLVASRLSLIETRVLFWLAFATAIGGGGLSWLGSSRATPALVLPEFITSLLLGAALLIALGGVLLRSTPELRVERIASSVAIAPVVGWTLESVARTFRLGDVVISIAPASAAVLVAGASVTIALRRPNAIRWPRDVGIAIVAIPALILAAPSSLWLILLLIAVSALLLAVSPDGLIGSESSRRYLAWLALALGTAGLWWRLVEQEVSGLEPYVLPLAGALLLIALFSWRGQRASVAAPLIALAGLLVALVPLGAQAVTDDDSTRTIVIVAASGTLVVGASIVRSTALRPWLDAAAAAGAAGLLVAALGRSLAMATAGTRDDLSLDAWLGASLALVLIAAIGQSRLKQHRPARALVGQVAVGVVLAAIVLVEFSLIGSDPISTWRSAVTLAVFSALYVVAMIVDRAPLPRVIAWVSLGFAAIIALVALGTRAVEPLEWATGCLAAALLIAGAAMLRRFPAAGSWPWLAPGLLVLFVPTLLATFSDQPIWRLVGLGIAGVAAILIGALAQLQAPLLVGAAVVLVHGIRTFAPQLVAVYQLTEWWVWAVIGGALIVFVAITFERRLRDVKTVGGRVSALR